MSTIAPPNRHAIVTEIITLGRFKSRTVTTVKQVATIRAQLRVLDAARYRQPMTEEQIRGHAWDDETLGAALAAHRWLSEGGAAPSAWWREILQ